MQKFTITIPFILLVFFLNLGYCVTNISQSANFIDIGNGRHMFIECQGEGFPTVVLIAGHRDRGDASWDTPLSKESSLTVFSEVSKFTRVCLYDRPGTARQKEQGFDKSRSDSIPQPTTISLAVKDLHKLISLAKISSPYVLVGHSAGGLIARLYTSTYPKEVAGLVLVDALSEELYKNLTPEHWAVFQKINAVPKEFAEYKNVETINFVKSFQEISQAAPIGYLPVIVLTADQAPEFAYLRAHGQLPPETPSDFDKKLWNAQLKAQNSLAKLFPHAKHITKMKSGHYIQMEQPQLVIKSIREVVDTVRQEAAKNSNHYDIYGSHKASLHPKLTLFNLSY